MSDLAGGRSVKGGMEVVMWEKLFEIVRRAAWRWKGRDDHMELWR